MTNVAENQLASNLQTKINNGNTAKTMVDSVFTKNSNDVYILNSANAPTNMVSTTSNDYVDIHNNIFGCTSSQGRCTNGLVSLSEQIGQLVDAINSAGISGLTLTRGTDGAISRPQGTETHN